jgi:multiple sugar transport system ATP-binding protein
LSEPVSLRQLVKVYGHQVAVKGIDLDIEKGSFVAFVGPSGCGKSTTLRMIAGLETVSHGEIRIGSRVVNDVPSRDRGIAMVFQSYALYPHMTVYENMAFALKVAKVSKAEIDQRVRRAAGILQLEAYLERRTSQLSGGQRQRVAMGRAIIREPQVFLFDEPLSNLDAQLRSAMRVEIKRLHKKLGSTSIYVTHDQTEAMTMADKIVILREGVIEQAGAPLEVFERPANRFVATFIGSPAMNTFDGRIVADGDGLAVALADGSRITLGAGRFGGLAAGARGDPRGAGRGRRARGPRHGAVGHPPFQRAGDAHRVARQRNPSLRPVRRQRDHSAHAAPASRRRGRSPRFPDGSRPPAPVSMQKPAAPCVTDRRQ